MEAAQFELVSWDVPAVEKTTCITKICIDIIYALALF
jgi:hypothetical protein